MIESEPFSNISFIGYSSMGAPEENHDDIVDSIALNAEINAIIFTERTKNMKISPEELIKSVRKYVNYRYNIFNAITDNPYYIFLDDIIEVTYPFGSYPESDYLSEECNELLKDSAYRLSKTMSYLKKNTTVHIIVVIAVLTRRNSPLYIIEPGMLD